MKIKEEEMIKMLLNGMPRDILINTNYTLYKDSNLKDLEIKQLQDRIDKAIEYIEDNYMTYKEASAYRDGIDNDYKIQISSIADLIDILKGSDPNE